ncbi:Hypothetical predicted protein, partial [Olea europaea subsp. europaea]
DAACEQRGVTSSRAQRLIKAASHNHGTALCCRRQIENGGEKAEEMVAHEGDDGYSLLLVVVAHSYVADKERRKRGEGR